MCSICPDRVTGETNVFASQCKLRKGHGGRRNYDAHRVDFSARILQARIQLLAKGVVVK